MTWRKGQSGNPQGRRTEKDAGSQEVQSLAKKYTEEALERLAYWMRSDNPKASVSASSAILDRGHGKPSQVIAGDPDAPLHVVQKIQREIVRANASDQNR